MKANMLALGLVSLINFSSSYAADELVGKTVPPFAKVWQDHGGACLADCNYSIGVLKSAKQHVFYLGKNARKANEAKPRWLVLDQMPYPETPKGYEVVYAACEVNGKADPEVLAVVKIAEAEWFDTVRFAYRANTAAGQFETISSKGVRCQNIGWGL